MNWKLGKAKSKRGDDAFILEILGHSIFGRMCLGGSWEPWIWKDNGESVYGVSLNSLLPPEPEKICFETYVRKCTSGNCEAHGRIKIEDSQFAEHIGKKVRVTVEVTVLE